jgi:hypothetical protein
VGIWDVSAARTHYVGAKGNAVLGRSLGIGVPSRIGIRCVLRKGIRCAVHNSTPPLKNGKRFENLSDR